MSRCQLCPSDFAKQWNIPLIESPNFRVLPSLGALVEGWVLISPRQHFLSVGALPTALLPELQELKETVREHLTSIYGPVCMFEHGPAKEQRNVGCGVDHAHLHMVPVDFDLSAAVTPYLPRDSRLHEANLTDCQAASRDGEDYLYLEQPIGQGRIARHRDLGSQLFRRAIAAHLGVPGEFNWRTNPRIENVNQTIEAFKGVKQGGVLAFNVPEHAA
jgi:ATP adenylyltransferase